MWIFSIVCPIAAIVFALYRRLYEKKIKRMKGGPIVERMVSTKPLVAYGTIPVFLLVGMYSEFKKNGELSSSSQEFFINWFLGWVIGAIVLFIEKKTR